MSQQNFVRMRVLVSGKVQKVLYRQNTVKQAEKLDISGWIRNRTDGDVEALIIGKEDNINKMLAYMKKGSKKANVKKLKIQSTEEIGYNPFEGGLKINPTI